MEYIEPSHIKINLTLRVLDRRPDGYHNIATVFWRLPSPEFLLISENRIGKDAVSAENIEIPGENIVSKTLAKLREEADIPFLSVKIIKSVPPGSGVGAGSGNAAAILRFTRRMYGVKPTPGTVARLGADVAFLAGASEASFASGAGEVLKDLPGEPEARVCIVFPDWSISTKNAYSDIDKSRGKTEQKNSAQENAKKAESEAFEIMSGIMSQRHCGLLPNDFLPVIKEQSAKYRLLAENALASGAFGWGLCGSGSSFFALFPKAGESSASAFYKKSSKEAWINKIYAVE